MPPLTMWDGDGHAWTDKDRLLALALHLHDASLCPDCGQPAFIAHDPEYEGWFEARTTICHACAAVVQGEKSDRAARGGKDPDPGEKRYPVFVKD